MIKIVINITIISNTIISKTVTPRTSDHTKRTRSTCDSENHETQCMTTPWKPTNENAATRC